MGQVKDRVAIVVDLVEHIVAEELEQVAIASLGPLRVHVEFGALVDKTESDEQTHETAVFNLLGHLALKHIGLAEIFGLY